MRSDTALAVMVGKEDLTGEHRRLDEDRGKALAGKSPLNRLELGSAAFSIDRYKKIRRDDEAIDIFCRPTTNHRRRLFWMRMPPMILCMVIRKGNFFMATTVITAICRYTSFVGSFSFAHD